MSIVAPPKTAFTTGPSPTENMWWTQTPNPRKAMRTPEKTTTGYPNRIFRENVGITSDTMPNAGRMRM